MTKLTQTLLESSAVLVVGLAIVGSLMFAFARNASAHDVASKVDASTLIAAPVVQIGGNGSALVRGAKVTNISDGTLTAQTAWGDSVLTWTVATGSDTDYVRVDGEDADRTDIGLNDAISFSGSLDQSTGALRVSAEVVRDWSLAAQNDSGSDKDAKDHHVPALPLSAKGSAGFSFGNMLKSFAGFHLFGHK